MKRASGGDGSAGGIEQPSEAAKGDGGELTETPPAVGDGGGDGKSGNQREKASGQHVKDADTGGRRKGKNESSITPHNTTSDDDFETGPSSFIRKQQQKKPQTNSPAQKKVASNKSPKVQKANHPPRDRTVYPKLQTRGAPFELVKAMGLMNDKQRPAVREMGFEHLIELKITQTPIYMGY